jgi:hypothetical protein
LLSAGSREIPRDALGHSGANGDYLGIKISQLLNAAVLLEYRKKDRKELKHLFVG